MIPLDDRDHRDMAKLVQPRREVLFLVLALAWGAMFSGLLLGVLLAGPRAVETLFHWGTT